MYIEGGTHANPKVIQALVEAGACIPLRFEAPLRQTLLHDAARKGQLDVVRLLTGSIGGGGIGRSREIIPVDTMTSDGATALDVAACALQDDVLSYLLTECGARLRSRRKNIVLQHILAHRASGFGTWTKPNSTDPTALPSLENTKIDLSRLSRTIELLLNHQADDLSTLGAEYMQGLVHDAFQLVDSFRSETGTLLRVDWFFKLLLQGHVGDLLQISHSNPHRYGILVELARHGYTEYIDFLLKNRRHELDIDEPICDIDHDMIQMDRAKRKTQLAAIGGRTRPGAALMYACSKGHFAAAEILLERDARAFWDLSYGLVTPLASAALAGRARITHLLLQHGAQAIINAQSPDGSTILHSMLSLPTKTEAWKRSTKKQIMEILSALKPGNSLQDSPSEYSFLTDFDNISGAENPNYALVIRILLDYGADTDIKNQRGRSVREKIQPARPKQKGGFSNLGPTSHEGQPDE